MDNETATPVISTKTIAVTALMAAIMCILGPLAIPIGPIPLSLALIGVYLCAYTLGAKRGTLAVAIYILIGTIGLPVFSGFSGGVAKLLGPTGGYIAGYLFTAFICGVFVEIFDNFFIQLAGMAVGLFACYFFGTLWFMFEAKVGFMEALATCVIPFVAFDLIKIGLAMVLGRSIRAALKSAGII